MRKGFLGWIMGAALLAACGHTGASPAGTPGGTGAPNFHPVVEPGTVASASPTAAPTLPGAAVRVQPASLGTGTADRTLILSNAAPASKSTFNLTLTDTASAYKAAAGPEGQAADMATASQAFTGALNVQDEHLARLRAEAAALAGVRPAWPARYRLAAATPREVGSSEPFYVLLDTDPAARREKQIQATLAARGEHCYVWVDPEAAQSADDKAQLSRRVADIVSTFDSQIYPTDTRLFGNEPNPGVDGEARIHILISPAVNDYGKNSTLGYYSRRDEYPADPNGPPVIRHSNAKELINVSSSVVLTGSPEDYLGTVAHEFQHMINYNQKVLLGHASVGEDLWLDEGMAMYALEANGYGLRGGGQVLNAHVRAFEDNPGAYSLNDWTDNPQGIGYGPVYLFTVYLADRFGEGILREIVTSPRSGFDNLEARLEAHGARFTDIFADWAAANLLDHQPGANARLSYASLNMHGTYGGVTLPGFNTQSIAPNGSASIDLRPCSVLYAGLGKAATLPKIGVGAGVEVGPALTLSSVP